MENKKKVRLGLVALILGLAVALGPATGGFFVGKGIERFKTSDRSVTVKGLVEKEVKSDRAVWTIQFRRAGNDLDSIRTQLMRDKKNVIDFLKAKGAADTEIKLLPTSINDTQTKEHARKDTLNRFIMYGTVVVDSTNVEKIQKLYSQTDELIQLGIIMENTSNVNPKYLLLKFNDMRPELIAAATQNARKMAEQFAHDSGTKVGTIRRANQGVIQILPTDGGDLWQGAQRTLMKKLRVVSTLTFFLENE